MFYHDVEAEGCEFIENDAYRCFPTADNTFNNDCASTLQVTVTPDAYFDDDNQQPGGGDTNGLVAGSAERTDTIVLSRADVEAQAEAMFLAMPIAERTLTTAPTMEEMLVSGTAANGLLTSMLTVEQRPHVVYPLTFEAVDSAVVDAAGGGHRRTQVAGAGVRVQTQTRAATPDEAQSAIDSLQINLGTAPARGRRRAQEHEAELQELRAILAAKDSQLHDNEQQLHGTQEQLKEKDERLQQAAAELEALRSKC